MDDAVENSNNSDINSIDLLFSQKGKFKSRGWLILTQDQRHYVILSLFYMVAMWVQQLQPPHLCSKQEHGRKKKKKKKPQAEEFSPFKEHFWEHNPKKLLFTSHRL